MFLGLRAAPANVATAAPASAAEALRGRLLGFNELTQQTALLAQAAQALVAAHEKQTRRKQAADRRRASSAADTRKARANWKKAANVVHAAAGFRAALPDLAHGRSGARGVALNDGRAMAIGGWGGGRQYRAAGEVL